MNYIVQILQKHPELAVFSCLAAGYWFGGLKLGRFSLGSVVGTLIVALLVGQAHVTIPDFVKTLFFGLFMFATGYRVGPQFFSGLRKGGLPLVTLSLVFCIVGIGMVLLMARVFGLDKGSAAGLLSGALTQSSVIGTATDAINNLPLTPEAKQVLASNVPIGDAVTYIFGVIAPAIFLSKFAARMLHTNLKTECAKMEASLRGVSTGPSTSGAFDAYVAVDLEAFLVQRPEMAGQTIGAVEQRLPDRCYFQQVRQGNKVFTPNPDVVLNIGDVLVVSGNREELIKVESMIGPQIVDPEAMDMPFETVPVIVTERAAIGKTIGELREAAPARAK